jgi:hypothetical protein
MHEVLRKSIFILITVLLLGGCASKQSKHNSNASIETPSLVVVITSETHWTNAHWPIGCSIKKIDSQQDIGQFSKISPGRHFISIKIIWSNFYEEEISLIVDTVSGKRYEIYALETDRGDEGKVKIEPLSVGQEFSSLLLYPLGYTAAYLYSPIFFGKVFHSLLVPPKGRPEGRVCFVWVENADTHQLIAGVKPNNGDKNLDEE